MEAVWGAHKHSFHAFHALSDVCLSQHGIPSIAELRSVLVSVVWQET